VLLCRSIRGQQLGQPDPIRGDAALPDGEGPQDRVGDRKCIRFPGGRGVRRVSHFHPQILRRCRGRGQVVAGAWCNTSWTGKNILSVSVARVSSYFMALQLSDCALCGFCLYSCVSALILIDPPVCVLPVLSVSTVHSFRLILHCFYCNLSSHS
jgi:hypothetical protein